MVTITATAMSLEEAQWCVSEIKQGIINIRERIWELYTRDGWQVLGYQSWQACKEQEFGASGRHVERLLAAARVERNLPIDATHGSHGPMPERTLRPLTGLKPAEQRSVWAQVVQENPEGHITGATVQEVVDRVTKDTRDNGNTEDTEEYRSYEREVLLPRLHDAGLSDAPQILSGQHEAFQPVPDERQEEAKESLRQSIIDILALCREGHTVDECADEMLDIMGQSSKSISLAVHFGIALSGGPQTLSDLTALAAQVCGTTATGDDYLKWHKRAKRLVDSLTYSGCGIYEHTLANGQICYALTKEI